MTFIAVITLGPSNNLLFSDKKSGCMASKIQVEKTTFLGLLTLLHDFLSGISALCCFRWRSELRCFCMSGLLVSDDMTLQNQPCSGRPPTIENDELYLLVEGDPRKTTHGMATSLLIERSNSLVHEHLIVIGKQQTVKWNLARRFLRIEIVDCWNEYDVFVGVSKQRPDFVAEQCSFQRFSDEQSFQWWPGLFSTRWGSNFVRDSKSS